jgi:hypothetical protein
MLLLAGCTPTAPQPADTGDNEAVAVSVPGPETAIGAGNLPTPELDGVPTLAGRWRRDRAAAGDAAIFVEPTGRPVFALRCARAQRRLLFVLAGSAGQGAAGSMKIITASGAASYPAMPRRFAPGSMAMAAAEDSFITTALEPTRAPSPTVKPPSTCALAPTITPLPSVGWRLVPRPRLVPPSVTPW